MPTAVVALDLRPATRASYAAFIGTGVALSTWFSRIPQVRDGLQLNASELGLVLLAMAAGAILSMPLSGAVLPRIGSRRMVTLMAFLMAVGLGTVAVGYQFGVVPVVIGLFLLGIANGCWDVAMNVQGATVERLLGRAIMPRFHAGFSIGTVAGALVGAAMVALDVSVTTHLAAVGILIAGTVPFAVRPFVPDRSDTEADADTAAPSAWDGSRRTFQAWREPRTLLVGLFVLTFAFAEGTGNDWIAIALIDGYGVSAAVATLGFAFFLSAMTAGRWFGPALLDRYGRVTVVRLLTGVSVVGLAIFVFGPNPIVAFGGAVLWGFGTSLGFPVGMSAAADDPAMAAARVSVVASIGYVAFLGGPPLIGFLGDQITVLRALTAVAVLLGLALLIAGNLRPPTTVEATGQTAIIHTE